MLFILTNQIHYFLLIRTVVDSTHEELRILNSAIWEVSSSLRSQRQYDIRIGNLIEANAMQLLVIKASFRGVIESMV